MEGRSLQIRSVAGCFNLYQPLTLLQLRNVNLWKVAPSRHPTSIPQRNGVARAALRLRLSAGPRPSDDRLPVPPPSQPEGGAQPGLKAPPSRGSLRLRASPADSACQCHSNRGRAQARLS
eukprot:1825386-Rhodomonas_salina.3